MDTILVAKMPRNTEAAATRSPTPASEPRINRSFEALCSAANSELRIMDQNEVRT